MTALSDANKRLRILSRRLMAAQELERWVIARELHDEIEQALPSLTFNLRTLRQQQQRPNVPSIEKQVSDSFQILDQVLSHTRSLAIDLRTPRCLTSSDSFLFSDGRSAGEPCRVRSSIPADEVKIC
jgi:signal transduction histidine kinase